MTTESKTHDALWSDFDGACREAGLTVEVDVPLGPMTTYGVGGHARRGVRIGSADDAVAVASVLSAHRAIDVLIVGRGSNLLVADNGFDGLALMVGGSHVAEELQVVGDLVTVSGWMSLPVLARRAVAAGRCGLQWAVGVPGSVGGGVRMNAGGHGSDIAANLMSVDLLSLRSGSRRTVAAQDLGLHFRGSGLAAHHLVLAATFRTTSAEDSRCEDELAEIVAWRRAHQPGGRNAGSVFVNPGSGSDSAGAIIDSLGLRGLRVGAAAVSDKHANFIQADESASAEDVIAVMMRVQDAVAQHKGVVLRSEVCLVGFADDIVSRFVSVAHHEPVIEAARAHLCHVMGDDHVA